MESPVWSEPLKGSIILATGGCSQEDGPALFEMGHSSAVRGLTVWYPEQQTTNITAYAWTFHLQGHDNTVENVTLINSYNGIRVGPEPNVRHRIRSVYGCVLRRGLQVDACTWCGKCEEACPGHNTGFPLSPRVLVQAVDAELLRTRAKGNGDTPSLQAHHASGDTPDLVGLMTDIDHGHFRLVA